jgi:hypothetical protein
MRRLNGTSEYKVDVPFRQSYIGLGVRFKFFSSSQATPPQGGGKLTPLLTTQQASWGDSRGGRDVSLLPSVPQPFALVQDTPCKN